jgi:Cdc6-like AAA superfamily ATPase
MYKSLAENGILNDAILLPVENHPELFGYEAKNSLALARLKGKNLELELVTFRFVERDFIGEEYKVREEIRQELEATKAALFETYLNPSAPDYPVRNKVLSNIFRYYLERATRYAFIDKGSPAYSQFRAALNGLISGNQKFTCIMRGLILKPSGVTQPVEDFHGIKIQVQGPLGLISHGRTEKLTEYVDRPGIKEAELVGKTFRILQESPEPLLATKEGSEETVNKSGETIGLEVLLGNRTDTGQSVFWSPTKVTPKRLANQHILIVGKSGSGKTQTIYALVYELSRNGIPSLLLDFHGEYCDSNSARFRESVNATVLDAAHGIPINPLTIPPDPLTGEPSDYRNVVYQVTESLADIFSLGDIQKRILKKAVERTFVSAGFTRDPLTWAKKAPAFGDVWKKLLEIEQEERGKAQNLVARVEPLFESEVFIGGKETFEDIMRRVTIIRLSSLANKELRTAISRFFLQKVYEHMLSMGPAEKQRLFCVLDEAHKLSHDPTITDLIKEARKYGVGLILSSQETKDFDRSIFANTGTLIALQLEVEDAKVMAENLGLLQAAERQAAIEILLRQQPGQALVRNNHYQPYVQVNIKPFLERLKNEVKLN